MYVIEDEHGKEILIPAIPHCILDVDLDAQGMIGAHLLDGLLDL